MPWTYRLQLDEVCLGVRLRHSLRSKRHVVLDSEITKVWHPFLGDRVVITQFAHWVAALFRHCSSSDEVIRRRACGFEKQPLHRTDASLCPEWQQHERHRRSVFVQLTVVLPHGTPAAVHGIVTQFLHRLHDVVVLAVRSLTFVTFKIPPRPAIGECT